NAVDNGYGGNGLVCFASKAFCCKEIFRIATDEGLGADVVSEGELLTASSVGLDMKNVCVHGNNKTRDELSAALRAGAGRIVVDNFEELVLLGELCAQNRLTANIMLRITPGVEAHTHDYVRTGQNDSKFGFLLETGEAMKAVKVALKMPNISLTGVHCHIGSQIFGADPFVIAAQIMMDFMADIKKETGVELGELNLGGGFGIVYVAGDSPALIGDVLQSVFDAVKAAAQKHKLQLPFLIFEPGRAIVAESGTTLYNVGGIKNIPGIRTYVAVNGGMCDNPRYCLYGSKYEMAVANKANQPKNTVVTVAGKCCESGDKLGENIPLQATQAGDILAVFCTGAYNFSMYITYNRNLRPAVVMVSKGKSRIVVRRNTINDLLQNDL
ncbi:MAG: diaminopimelate decarboxylase, partial [Firmicutes bacterium]|nr:diaminopimelate decarboxylase [Bacillota bacterium]